MARALIIVDVQKDFCEDGLLAVPGGADVAARISAALGADANRGRWEHVVATKDFHVEPGAHFSDSPDYESSWPAHCVAGSPGAEFHPQLEPERIEEVFTKGSHTAAYSGFEGQAGGIGLAAWLRMREIDAVDVAGIATDYCVRATALDAVREGFDTTLLLDLCVGVDQAGSQTAVREMAAAGVHIAADGAADGATDH